MYATSAPQTGVPALDYALTTATYRFHAVLAQIDHSESTVVRAYLRGQEEALTQIIESLHSILDFQAADWERTFQLRMLTSLLYAREKGERREATAEERQRLNSLEWRQVVRGRLDSYKWGINLLRFLGFTPLR